MLTWRSLNYLGKLSSAAPNHESTDSAKGAEISQVCFLGPDLSAGSRLDLLALAQNPHRYSKLFSHQSSKHPFLGLSWPSHGQKTRSLLTGKSCRVSLTHRKQIMIYNFGTMAWTRWRKPVWWTEQNKYNPHSAKEWIPLIQPAPLSANGNSAISSNGISAQL